MWKNHIMINEDGTYGFHYKKKDIDERRMQMGYNDLATNDCIYVVNMLYSDYSPLVGNDLTTYIKMAKLFIKDKDAPEGKAIRYYLAMH